MTCRLAVFDQSTEAAKPQHVLPPSGATSNRKSLSTSTPAPRFTAPPSIGTVPSHSTVPSHYRATHIIGTPFY